MGFGATGYAADVLEECVKSDVNIVETVAHMLSAVHFFGDVDVICDIGGQDIKVLFMKNGDIANFRLSNSLLGRQRHAAPGDGRLVRRRRSRDFADVAFKAELAPKFSYGCAVFLETDRVNFQKEGFSKEEMLAGLAQVLPKNVWQYVVQIPRLASLGTQVRPPGRHAVQPRGRQGAGRLHQGARPRRRGLRAPAHRRGRRDRRGDGDAARREAQGQVDVHRSRCRRSTSSTRRRTTKRRSVTSVRTSASARSSTRRRRTAAPAATSPASPARRAPSRAKEAMLELVAERKKIAQAVPQHGRLRGEARVHALLRRRRRMPEDGLADQGHRGQEGHLRLSVASRSRARSSAARRRRRSSAAARASASRACSTSTRRRRSSGRTSRRSASRSRTSSSPTRPPRRCGSRAASTARSTRATRRRSRRRTSTTCSSTSTRDEEAAQVHLLPDPHARAELRRRTRWTTPSCPIVAGAPDVMKAAFTKEVDFFADARHRVRRSGALVRRAEPHGEAHVRDLGPAPRHHRGRERPRVPRGLARARRIFENDLQEKGRAILETVEAENRVAILLVGRPYHSDPGLNHGIPEEFQVLGYPILSRALDPEATASTSTRYFKEELARGQQSPLEHQRRVAGELLGQQRAEGVGARSSRRTTRTSSSSTSRRFKCGHDAPIYGLIDTIIREVEDAVRGAPRHRREQARRLDQDPRQDVRPRAQAPRGDASRTRRKKEHELAHAHRQEAPRAPRAARRSSSQTRTRAGPGARRADRGAARRRSAPYVPHAGRPTRPSRPKGARAARRRRPRTGRIVPAVTLATMRRAPLDQTTVDRHEEEPATSSAASSAEEAPDRRPDARHRRRAEARSRRRSASASASTATSSSGSTTWSARASRRASARTSRCSSAASPSRRTSSSRARCKGIGYNVADTRLPDNAGLQAGKEFGNRGQCNPTYFTVGNLVKYLIDAARQARHDARRRSSRTTSSSPPAPAARAASACTSPSTARRCATPASTASASCSSSRRAASSRRPATSVGLELNPTFFSAIVKAHRRRRRAQRASATASAPTRSCRARRTAPLEEAKKILYEALDEHDEHLAAPSGSASQIFAAVEVDKLRSRSRRSRIIGEFWAMTTEGDGNYQLQKFLEQRGRRVRHPAHRRVAALQHSGRSRATRASARTSASIDDGQVRPRRRRTSSASSRSAWRSMRVGEFGVCASLPGVRACRSASTATTCPTWTRSPRSATDYYNNDLRGGEGHMEVGKLILNVVHEKAHMTLSVKPFGCMPSVGRLRRRAVADHRAVPRHDLLRGRDERRRRASTSTRACRCTCSRRASRPSEELRKTLRRVRRHRGAGPRVPRRRTRSTPRPLHHAPHTGRRHGGEPGLRGRAAHHA